MGITLWQYFCNRAAQVAQQGLDGVESRADWLARRPQLYKAFMRSMGLDPLPERCDLKVNDCGGFSGRGYTARRLAYQIVPDCWGSATFYLPDPCPPGRLPAVLYACGHQALGTVGYQRHPLRWARRGYACLIFDTIEQHDNRGEHHGLYAQGRGDWLSRGYSAAGGELWNSTRALDVLASRPEVDPQRLGTTGVSGGGVMSFLLAVADERIRAVSSLCGVSAPRFALQNRHLHNHCDCMYGHYVEGETGLFAGLIAPRPLLLCYAEDDLLFCPEEYRGIAERGRHVYRLLEGQDRCELFTAPGPHGDKPAFVLRTEQWFDQHVAGPAHSVPDDLGAPAIPGVEQPESVISTFNGAAPSPNRLDLLPELLSPRGEIELPRDAAQWPRLRAAAVERLRTQVLDGLDRLDESLTLAPLGCWQENASVQWRKYQGQVAGMDLWLETRRHVRDDGTVLLALADDQELASDVLGRLSGQVVGTPVRAALESRVSGNSTPHPALTPRLLRAGALVGLTPVMLMIQDLRLALVQARELEELRDRRIYLYGRGDAAVACLYTALLDEQIAGLVLESLPPSHVQGGHILGVLRVMDVDHAVGLMAPRPVCVVSPAHGYQHWSIRAYERLGCPERLAYASSLRGAFERLAQVQPQSGETAKKERPAVALH